MRSISLDAKFFKNRRQRLADRVKNENAAFVFYSGTSPCRSNDTHYSFRPESNFFYLTGFEEPGSVFIFRPGKTPESVLFVQKKDPLLETWEGFLFGPELAKAEFQMDETFVNTEFNEKAAKLLEGVDKVYYRMGLNSEDDNQVVQILNRVLRAQGRKGNPLQSLHDPNAHLAPLRVVKTAEEIELMKKTCSISAKAHIDLIKATNPGINERALHGVFLSSIMQKGASTEAYSSIVATGNNATTLHYVFNDQACKEGDLLLVDAGSEYRYYAGDITRTFPVSGKFNETQKRIYNKVLEVQLKLIDMVQPGCTFKALNETCAEELVKILIEEGVLKDSLEKVTKDKLYKKYYPHGVGHFLGIDVHDVGYYEQNEESCPFVPGMVLTIEPGLYFPETDKDLPSELKGMGIRIEDDILVTETGNEVLTSEVPKGVVQLEELLSH